MLFQPSNIYPSTFSGIGAGTVDVTQGINVSWQVNGDTPMTAYQIKIYQNDSGSTLMYDSGSVSVSPVFEPHDKNGNATYFTAIISAAALSTAGIVNGYQYGYKMLITQWWGVSDYVEQTSASVFITRSTPTLAINTITTPVASSSLTITANYSQAQGDPISTVEWVFALAGSESTPIRKTGAISTQVLSFDADGLITGNTYSIMCKVVTSTGMEASTGFVQFPVSYSSSSLGINYQLAQLKNSSAVYLSWDDLGSNKLAYPYTDTTKTTNGITFTVNGEGDVVATGTASADAYFTIAQGTLSQLGITAGQKFIVTSGYSGAKIVVTETNSSNVVVSTITGNDPLQYIATSTTNTLKFSIVIPSGSVLSSGQQLKPMIALEDKIVAFNDVSANIEPTQDLHGYSSPWPAGGGVNKYPNCVINGSQNGLIVSHDAGNERYNISAGTVSGYAQIISGETFTLSAGTYYWHVDYSSGSVLAGLAPQLRSTDGSTTYATPNTSFTLSADTELKPRITCQANVTIPSNFSVRLEIVSGSTAPTSWTPYSNICPITGRTGLSVYDDPKYGGTVAWNQLVENGNFANGTSKWTGSSAELTASNGIARSTMTGSPWNNDIRQYTIPVVNGHKYFMGATIRQSSDAFSIGYRNPGGQMGLNWFRVTQWTRCETIINVTSSAPNGFSITVRENGTNLTDEWFEAQNVNVFDLTAMFGSTIADYIYSLEQADAGAGVAWFRNLFPKPYYAYNAGEETCVSAVNGDPYTKVSVDWTTEAGTVYGGTLDVVTGLLTVDRAMVDLGTMSWFYQNSAGHERFGGTGIRGTVAVPVSADVVINAQCSRYKVISSNQSYNHNAGIGISVTNTDGTIYVYDDAYTDSNAFRTAMSGVQFCYPLATPLTYQLTPTQVAVLTGTNNVWSTGDSVSVTYTKDTGSQATLSGAIVTFSDSNAVLIPTPQYIPGITGISIYRYLQGESALQHVYDLATGATSILDYYAPSQMQVSYLIVAHSGIGDLFLQTTKFTPTFWFFSILLCDTDSNGDYHVSKEYIFKYGVETGAVSNNNDPTIQKNFTPYPNRQPISTLYKTGKISGYIGKTNNLNRYSDSISLQNAIYDISVSSLDKFLKSRKGDVIKVDTASSIQMKTEDNTVQQALKATVDWVEVGEASQVSIVSVPSDSFWPIS